MSPNGTVFCCRIRLDSGDLAYFSKQARRMLDEAGFPDAKVVAGNELDEYVITSLKLQGARIDLWGVGTKLVTAHDDPALLRGPVVPAVGVVRKGE